MTMMILRYSNPSSSLDLRSSPPCGRHLAPPEVRLIVLLVGVGSVLPHLARREGVGDGSWFVLLFFLGLIPLPATCALRQCEVSRLVERTNWLAKARYSNTVPRFPYGFMLFPSVYGRFGLLFLACCPRACARSGVRSRTGARSGSIRAPCAPRSIPVGSCQGDRLKPAQNV